MIDPTYALQKAVYEALANAPLSAPAFDTIPAKQSLPYIEYGVTQMIRDTGQLGPFNWYDGEVEAQAFGRTKAESLALASEIVEALNVVLDCDAPVSCHHRRHIQTLPLPASNGVYATVVEMTYRVQSPD